MRPFGWGRCEAVVLCSFAQVVSGVSVCSGQPLHCMSALWPVPSSLRIHSVYSMNEWSPLGHKTVSLLDTVFPWNHVEIMSFLHRENAFIYGTVCPLHIFMSPGFWFFSEDQGSKVSENTGNRKEADEVCNTKSSSQIPVQPSVAKGPYGKGPPFNQVCWTQGAPYHYRYCGWINLTVTELEEHFRKGNCIFLLA